MGDSYREEIKRKKTRSGYASQTLVREGTARGAEVRKEHLRKSSARRGFIAKAQAAQARLM